MVRLQHIPPLKAGTRPAQKSIKVRDRPSVRGFKLRYVRHAQLSRSLTIVSIGAVVLLLGVAARGAPPDPPSSESGSVVDRRASGPFVGVWTAGPSDQESAALDDLSVGWARVSVLWSTVQPSSGTFAWTALDQSMALASGNGRRSVLAMVRNNPPWAAASRCSLSTDLERQRLADFLGVLAARYTGVVWQLYNEMDNTSVAFDTVYDLGGCFATVAADGTPSADGRARYALAIEAAGAAVHAADPSAQLATGGVASGNFTEARGIFDRVFLPGVLAQLKQDNSLGSLDYVTVHYYSSQLGTYAATGQDLLGRVNQLREDALAAGLDQTELKPVLADELSYTGATGTSTGDPTNTFNRAQAAYVPMLLARAAAANIRAAFWFWLQDVPGGLGADNAYGLKDRTGTRKPAYRAMRFFASQIGRLDQFLYALNVANLEGYEFAAADGRVIQLVWTNQPGVSYIYVPTSTHQIVDVRDAAGDAVDFDAQANSVLIGAEPRYVVCSPVSGTNASSTAR